MKCYLYPTGFGSQAKRLPSHPFCLFWILKLPLLPRLLVKHCNFTPPFDQRAPVTCFCCWRQIPLISYQSPLPLSNAFRNAGMCSQPHYRLFEVGPIWIYENDIGLGGIVRSRPPRVRIGTGFRICGWRKGQRVGEQRFHEVRHVHEVARWRRENYRLAGLVERQAAGISYTLYLSILYMTRS